MHAQSDVNGKCEASDGCKPTSTKCCPKNDVVFGYLKSVVTGAIPWNFEVRAMPDRLKFAIEPYSTVLYGPLLRSLPLRPLRTPSSPTPALILRHNAARNFLWGKMASRPNAGRTLVLLFNGTAYFLFVSHCSLRCVLWPSRRFTQSSQLL